MKVRPEIMIPLVAHVNELARLRALVEDAIAAGHRASNAGTQVPISDRHDDRGAARRAHRRRDRQARRLLLVRHQRPHPDDLRLSRDDARKFLPAYVEHGHPRGRSLRHRSTSDGVGELIRIGVEQRPRDAPGPQGRHLRRARRRPAERAVLPRGRPRLRLLLAVPRARRAARGGPGGDPVEGGEVCRPRRAAGRVKASAGRAGGQGDEMSDRAGWRWLSSWRSWAARDRRG